MKRQLTIVNRHYPPNVNITGENAWDLANHLIAKHNIDVTIVHIDREYEGGGSKRVPVGNCFPIKTIYQGNNSLLSNLSGIWDGYFLIRKAKKLNRGPVIVMTSPPLLPMWGSIVLGRKKREWILWNMDSFPEGFVANNQVSSTNFLYKWVLKLSIKNPPNKVIALGPQQKKAIDKKYNAQIDSVILPCGVFIEQHNSDETPDWKTDTNKIYFGYAGNYGMQHSIDFIKAVIDAIDPDTQHLIIAVYGIQAEEVKSYAANKKGITLIASIPRNQLHHIDVHLVTLGKTWTHIAVPSKAVSSVCSGATILFCGNKESDNWVLLSEAGWLVEENNLMKENIQKTLSSISKEDIALKKLKAKDIAKNLSDLISNSYDTIATWAK